MIGPKLQSKYNISLVGECSSVSQSNIHPVFHLLFRVFLYASTFSNPIIVYIYFVLLVIIAVCILLNVIVAFFVESKFAQIFLVVILNVSFIT